MKQREEKNQEASNKNELLLMPDHSISAATATREPKTVIAPLAATPAAPFEDEPLAEPL